MIEGSIFSTYISDTALAERQARLFVSSLIGIGGVKAGQILIHRPVGSRTDLDRDLSALGIRRVESPNFESPYASQHKLTQLQTLARAQVNQVVLMSPGLFTARPVELPQTETVAAKLVDSPRPELAVLETVFRSAGLPMGRTVRMSKPRGKTGMTQRNNCNNRLLVFSGRSFQQIAPTWLKWAQWMGQNKGLTQGLAPQADQVSLALALSDLGMSADLLDTDWNYPAHLAKAALTDRDARFIFCHTHLNEAGDAEPTGLTMIDTALDRINRNNAEFWAAFGTGSSERQTAPRQKQMAPTAAVARASAGTAVQPPLTPNPRKSADLMRYLTVGFEDASVLQIGLADSALIGGLSLGSYAGYDSDKSRISQLKRRLPDRSFQVLGDDRFEYLPESDLVVALDEPFTHIAPETYIARLRQLADITQRRLVIRGYDYTPSGVAGYHGSLIEHLRGLKLFRSIQPIFRDKEEVVIVADKLLPGEDLAEEVTKSERMVDALTLTPRPALLAYLTDLARHQFGFFTTDFLRAVELPWVLSRAASLHRGALHLDIGTGLSPLPLYSARQGASVVTVDNHPIVATEANRSDWPSAGYFDYGTIDARCHSHHIDILNFRSRERFDMVTALAVIHLIDPDARKGLITQIREILSPDGDLFMSVRLIPRTDWIWNHKGRTKLAPKEVHGHLVGFKDLLEECGLEIIEDTTLRAIPNSQHNDVWLGHMRRS